MIRTIKRQLDIDRNSITAEYLLHNMHYRHKLYNKGVMIIRELYEKNPKKYISKFTLDTLIYERHEQKLPDYNIYCRGIRTMVCDDLALMLKSVFNNGKEYDSVEDRFKLKDFDPFHGSFGFNTKRYKNGNGEIASRVKDLGSNYITLQFVEDYHFTFFIKDESWCNKSHPYKRIKKGDISEIRFVYKNKKFYIHIVAEVSLDRSNKRNIFDRNDLAGIDLGEKNPAMIYDGVQFINVSLDTSKIDKIENRIRQIRRAIGKKKHGSNNYNKLVFKLHKLSEKQTNIRLDWRNKQAFKIVNLFDAIVVDRFNDATIHKGKTNSKKRKTVNHKVHTRGLGLFGYKLEEMAEKYSCEYIDANGGTTVTCSRCGHINKHIKLDERVFECSSCGYRSDRDENAAVNCYNQYDKSGKYVIRI